MSQPIDKKKNQHPALFLGDSRLDHHVAAQ
jgi:hypothetical protein